MGHTTGTWYEGSTGNHQGTVLEEGSGNTIAVAYDKADAPLLAAAPTLLAACQAALMDFSDDTLYAAHKTTIKTLEAAITAATKGTP